MTRSRRWVACGVTTATVGIGAALAQAPGEVANLQVGTSSTLTWSATASATDYNVYRGLVSSIETTTPRCHGNEIIGTSFGSPANPPAGDAYFYLVTAESAAGEGTPGTTSAGALRPLSGKCDAVVRNHVLERVGFGGDEWTRDRIARLGPTGYINEQLDPASISESGNTKLTNRRAPLVPPENILERVALRIVNGTYARRQLEEAATQFWENLFPINGVEESNSAEAEQEVSDEFRRLAFNGTFREMLETWLVTTGSGRHGTPPGTGDTSLAIDAIVAHPATARSIATQLIRKFVTDDPTPAQIAAVVAAWNDVTNPHGTGDLREVLRAVLTLPEMQDPDAIKAKAKTPIEHVITAFRALRGETDGITAVSDSLLRMWNVSYLTASAADDSEPDGDSDTNNLLERQTFALDLARRTAATDPNFSADVIGLLQSNGVSTAPGNAAGIVDFFDTVLFAGGMTPQDRQLAIDSLNTNDSGAPAPYDDARIRETVGVMLGYSPIADP